MTYALSKLRKCLEDNTWMTLKVSNTQQPSSPSTKRKYRVQLEKGMAYVTTAVLKNGES